MKKYVFSIVIVLLTAVFLVLYCLDPVRNFLLGLNAQWLIDTYSNLDQFFCFIWPKFWGQFIHLTPAEGQEGKMYGLVSVGTTVLLFVIILDVLLAVISKAHKMHAVKIKAAIQDETKNLSETNSVPPSFSELGKNKIVDANKSVPFVSLNKGVDPSINPTEIEIQKYKQRPSVRIALTIIYVILVLLAVFLRFVSQTQIDVLISAFGGFINMLSTLNDNLTAFFSTLLKGIYSSPLMTIGGKAFSWGQLVELLLEMIVLDLVWVIVLVICHLIVKNRRKHLVSSEEVGSKSKKNKIPEETAGANVNSIADINTFSSSVTRAKQLADKATYIDDIGEFVAEAGTKAKLNIGVAPSITRQPLAPEELGDDLSKNGSVTIRDIASIEDSFKKTAEDVISVEPTFIVPDESSQEVDLDSIEVSSISHKDAAVKEKADYLNKTDDMIAFDEDGYAYLVKSGKPFFDKEENISDVIVSYNLNKTAVIARFGRRDYDELDNLEPFKLRPLNYDEEINNVNLRVKSDDLIQEENILRMALTKDPFQDVEIKPKQEKAAPLEPVEEVEKIQVEEKKPEPVIQAPVIKTEEAVKPQSSIVNKEEKPEVKTEVKPEQKEKIIQPIKPVDPTHVSYSIFTALNNEQPKARKNEEAIKPIEVSKKEPEVLPPNQKKDLTKATPSFFVVKTPVEDTKPKGPIQAKIISIEDYLGKKKK